MDRNPADHAHPPEAARRAAPLPRTTAVKASMRLSTELVVFWAGGRGVVQEGEFCAGGEHRSTVGCCGSVRTTSTAKAATAWARDRRRAVAVADVPTAQLPGAPGGSQAAQVPVRAARRSAPVFLLDPPGSGHGTRPLHRLPDAGGRARDRRLPNRAFGPHSKRQRRLADDRRPLGHRRWRTTLRVYANWTRPPTSGRSRAAGHRFDCTRE
jgi:hypothetical protein